MVTGRKAVAALVLAAAFVLAAPPVLAAPSDVTLKAEVSGVHESYFRGSDGMFYPDQELTRAELAQLLYRVVNERPTTVDTFSDVADDAWYAEAIRTIAALGMMDGDDGAFRPEEAVTRAECAAALARLLPDKAVVVSTPPFSDVPRSHSAYHAIARVTAAGLFDGYGGVFRPDDGLLRCEAAKVFNRLLERSADEAELASSEELQIFADVPDTHWAYAEIMEATTTHDYSSEEGGERWTQVREGAPNGLADGFYRIGGALYLVQDGRFVYDTVYGVFTFDRNGRYTTGDAELDKQLNGIVEAVARPVSGRMEKLRALYNYVRDNYTYLKRPFVEPDQTNWEPEYAAFFLQNGKGNCYSFSATYCLLCREIGEDARTVVGLLGKKQSPHGWVTMQTDGVWYMYDPQLEWRYLHDYGLKGYNLFMMNPAKPRFTYTWLSMKPY